MFPRLFLLLLVIWWWLFILFLCIILSVIAPQFCKILANLSLKLNLEHLTRLWSILDQFLNNVIWTLLLAILIVHCRLDIIWDDPWSLYRDLTSFFLAGSLVVQSSIIVYFGWSHRLSEWSPFQGAIFVSLWLEGVWDLAGVDLKEPRELLWREAAFSKCWTLSTVISMWRLWRIRLKAFGWRWCKIIRMFDYCLLLFIFRLLFLLGTFRLFLGRVLLTVRWFRHANEIGRRRWLLAIIVLQVGAIHQVLYRAHLLTFRIRILVTTTSITGSSTRNRPLILNIFFP